jgi:hypothetical protein
MVDIVYILWRLSTPESCFNNVGGHAGQVCQSEKLAGRRSASKRACSSPPPQRFACGIAMTSGLCGSVVTSTLNQFSQIFAGIHDVPPKCVRSCIRIPFPADIEELPVSFARPV